MVRGRSGVRAVDGALAALGCWLVGFSAIAEYGVGQGVDAPAADCVVGAVLVLTGIARALGAPHRGASAAVTTAAATWLVLAPLVVDYGFGAHSTLATCAGPVFGIAVAAVALAGRPR